jgi:hypothetical protein
MLRPVPPRLRDGRREGHRRWTCPAAVGARGRLRHGSVRVRPRGAPSRAAIRDWTSVQSWTAAPHASSRYAARYCAGRLARLSRQLLQRAAADPQALDGHAVASASDEKQARPGERPRYPSVGGCLLLRPPGGRKVLDMMFSPPRRFAHPPCVSPVERAHVSRSAQE